MVELVYSPAARTTALAVWSNGIAAVEQRILMENGDNLVPFSPRNNLIRNEAVVLPEGIGEYGSDGSLLSEVTSFIHRYVDLSPTFEKVAAYYVLFTWIHDAFNELPYLRLRGDFGTGKTRALLAIGSLCYKAFFASGASTVSPIFHTLDAFRGTLVFDEADFHFSDERTEIVKILNNGNAKGLPVLRTVLTNRREFDPRAFHVFGPKIVATRGLYSDKALESRFITEEMGQRRLRAGIPINLPPEFKAQARSLRDKLLLYRFRNRAHARLDPSLVDPRIEPRLNQILVPLLSTIRDRDLHDELRAVAGAYHRDLVAERSLTVEAQVLSILCELSADNARSVALSDITTRFQEKHGPEYERPITPKWLGSVLRRLQLTTYRTSGVYMVPLTNIEKLSVLRERYGLSGDIGT